MNTQAHPNEPSGEAVQRAAVGGARHTPGPWAAEPPSDDESGDRYHWTVRAPGRSRGIVSFELARVSSMHTGHDEADARLIAAAPDMFEALDWLVQILPDPELDSDELQRTWAKKARAAIARATGEQS